MLLLIFRCLNKQVLMKTSSRQKKSLSEIQMVKLYHLHIPIVILVIFIVGALLGIQNYELSIRRTSPKSIE